MKKGDPTRLFPFLNHELGSPKLKIKLSSKVEGELKSISEDIYYREQLENMGFFKKFGSLIVKAGGYLILSIFGVTYNGLKIGVCEKESVIRCGIPVYGFFNLIINRQKRSIDIESVSHLSRSFRSFRRIFGLRIEKPILKSVLFGTIALIAIASFVVHYSKTSKVVWEKFFKTFSKNKMKEIVYNQKKVYCNECGLIPSNVMFKECRHLVYCGECFKNKHSAFIDEEKLTCNGVICEDCEKPALNYIKVFYN